MNSSLRLIFAVVAPFLLLMATGVSCNRAPESAANTSAQASPKSVAVTNVQPSSIDRKIEIPASIEGDHRTEIFPRIEGRVQNVYVKIGDQVEKDRLLVLLIAKGVVDQVRHREERLKETEAEIQRKVAGIKLAKAEVKSKEAALKIQKITKDRMEALVKRGSLNQQRLDEAIFEVRSAEADLQHAHAEVEAAEADFAVAEAKKGVALADLEAAKTQASYREIRAPFDGLITARNVDPGDLVKPHTPDSGKGLLDIVRYDQVRAVVYVPLKAAAYVDKGDIVVLSHQSNTGNDQIHSVSGQPLAISRVAHAFNKGSRMMRAEIDIDNAQLAKESGEPLIPGDYGKVWVTLEALKGKPMVPKKAIVQSEDSEGYLVLLDEQNIPQKLPIHRVLLETDGKAIIEAPGIEIGQTIIASGAEELSLGDPIDPEQIEEIVDE